MTFSVPRKAPLLMVAALLVLSAALVAAEKPKALTVWPGYILDLPPDHCVATRIGPDFHELYVRDRKSDVMLVGIYCGHHPDFQPDCVKPTKKTWKAHGLTFESVRGADGCAEFLIQEPGNFQRGVLHIWFSPGAKKQPETAEALIASIRPAPMPLQDVPDPPPCK